MRTFYVAWGSVRGGCGHKHRSVETARACVDRDRRACASLGGGAYSDRWVAQVDPDGWRTLVPAGGDQ